MKLRNCIRRHCNFDYIGIDLLENADGEIEVIKVIDLKRKQPFYLNYRVLNIRAQTTKFNVSLNEMPIVVYRIDL